MDRGRNAPTVLVLAYGSNMCTQRMQARVSSARPVVIGYVQQRKLVFHKRSEDGSAKADAMATTRSADRVWGVIYQLHRDQKPMLDRYEFLGVGYDEEQVEVVHANVTLWAWMYVARRDAIDPSLLPYSWYLDLITHGARQHGLPHGYTKQLQRQQSMLDPNSARHASHRRLITCE